MRWKDDDAHKSGTRDKAENMLSCLVLYVCRLTVQSEKCFVRILFSKKKCRKKKIKIIRKNLENKWQEDSNLLGFVH